MSGIKCVLKLCHGHRKFREHGCGEPETGGGCGKGWKGKIVFIPMVGVVGR